MIEEQIRAAMGEAPVDLLLRNAQVVNVFSGDIHPADIAIHKGSVVAFEPLEAQEIIDLKNLYVCPGFIDGHIHIESSMVGPAEFARVVVPHGTTTVVADPHEIANVLGLEGIWYMIASSSGLPLTVYLMLPSCVPSTTMETSGADIRGEELELFLEHPSVLGIAEMMNFPGVLARDPDIMQKLRIRRKTLVDGHCPLLEGKELSAYIAAGIHSDHESTSLEEAREKLRKGMYIMIREGTPAKNLETLLPLVTPENSRKCFFVTDDRHPPELLDIGHIDFMVRRAIELGLSPLVAIQMATINAAEYFRLEDLGAVAPGFQADLVVFEDLQKLKIRQVYKKGRLVAEDGKPIGEVIPRVPYRVRGTVNLNWERLSGFNVKARGKQIRLIEIIPEQLLTRQVIEEASILGDSVVADPARDLLKIAVIERHHASGSMGLGFVRGFGLFNGAIASTVAHDSHNIIVIGANDGDMMLAVRTLANMQGGVVLVVEHQIQEVLPLPTAGLMSELPMTEVRQRLDSLIKRARELGCRLNDPFMQMSFLALPVIPELKITDKGLVDVNKFEVVDLFVEGEG